MGVATGFAAGALGGGLVGMTTHDLGAWLIDRDRVRDCDRCGRRVGAGLPEEMKAPVCRSRY